MAGRVAVAVGATGGVSVRIGVPVGDTGGGRGVAVRPGVGVAGRLGLAALVAVAIAAGVLDGVAVFEEVVVGEGVGVSDGIGVAVGVTVTSGVALRVGVEVAEARAARAAESSNGTGPRSRTRVLPESATTNRLSASPVVVTACGPSSWVRSAHWPSLLKPPVGVP